MSLLRIQLLGDFYLAYDGRPVSSVNEAGVQSLFAYMLLHCHVPQARLHVAFTLWPDLDEVHARENLRRMLHELRHALPNAEEYIQVGASTIQWAGDRSFQLDVAEFEAALAQAVAGRIGAPQSSDPSPDHSPEHSAAAQALEAVLACYTGDLLPNCHDGWVAADRERLRQQAYKTGRQLMQMHEEQRSYAAAVAVGRRLLQLDPRDEAVYAVLIRLHALNNDRAAALRVYHDCVTILQHEAEVEPGEEVQAAYQQLLHSETRPAAGISALAGAVPLVGRAGEWAQLRAIWHDSIQKLPSLALLTGEAGIGKTRLAEELFDWAQRQGIAAARTRVYAAEGRLSFSPVTEWLRSAALGPALAHMDAIWRSELARLLPELLGQDPTLPPPPPLAENWQRQRFFEALARGVLGAASPLLLLVDDLQWCDQETLEWLRFLLRFDPNARLLVLGTARSEEIAANPALTGLLRALQSAGQLHEIVLGPLGTTDVASLAARIGRHELAAAEAMHLFRESDGVPLFVVELVRAGLDPATREPEQWREFAPVAPRAPAAHSLPPKLYAVIAGRLEQLSSTAREVAAVAATSGRAFTPRVLARAAGKDEETVIDALEELWQRRIISEQGPNAYDFSHDKLRDVAYGEISPIQRRRLHGRVAQALEEIHTDDLEAISSQLAVHYDLAGEAETAARHYRQASVVARRLLAYEEAIGHLQRGIALLEGLSATAARDQERQDLLLALLVALGALLATTKGNAAAEVHAVYSRALELCRSTGDKQQLFVVQQELRIGCGQRGETAVAHRLAQANLALAHELGSRELIRYARLGMGVVSHTEGELDLARAHFDQAIGQLAPQSGAFDPLFFDSALQASLRHSALTLWLSGYPEQARARIGQALAVGRQSPQSIRYAITLYFAAMLHHYLGEIEEVRLRAEEIKSLATAYGFTYYLAAALMFEGWALAAHGKVAEGAVQLRQGLEMRKASGHCLFLPYELGLLAEACLMGQNAAAGLEVLQEALAVADRTGERVWQAELLRLHAELLAVQGAPAVEIEANCLQAISVARHQMARSLELRTGVTLARRWQAASRSREAHQLLAPVYAWFTEGHDTPDLRAAAALLHTLPPVGS
ncbi:MAG: AAA family ATPase [Caldilineaceae bacterium]